MGRGNLEVSTPRRHSLLIVTGNKHGPGAHPTFPLPNPTPYNKDGSPIEENHAALWRSHPPDELH